MRDDNYIFAGRYRALRWVFRWFFLTVLTSAQTVLAVVSLADE